MVPPGADGLETGSDDMTTITMSGPATATRTPAVVTGTATAARFVGHFLAALVGVALLGRHVDH
ncbi:hypothetical protein GCM10009660_44700 [Catellatospora bangladeshensis]